MRYLVAIDDAGHVGRAAEALYVSQPALSYALRNLEAELGVRLFDRHARGVTATEAGGEVIREARAVVLAADRVTIAADRYRRGLAGLLRVGFEATGAGLLTTRSRADYYARPDLAWVLLTDVAPLQVALAWPEGSDSALVRDFAAVVRDLAR